MSQKASAGPSQPTEMALIQYDHFINIFFFNLPSRFIIKLSLNKRGGGGGPAPTNC